MKKILIIITFLMILYPALVYARDGYDYDTGG
jgi:hypothetical protein